MAEREAEFERDLNLTGLTAAEIVQRGAEQRRRAAQHRAQAAEYRARAAEDRQAAARDRAQAARDRARARADLEALVKELEQAETDALTGARTRAAGLRDLDNELDRCRRTNATLVVVYVDVVGLKTVNDTQGHAAGDALLTRVVDTIAAHLRSYDLIVRLGGDEFLCAMPYMTLAEAHRRFAEVGAAIAASPRPSAIRTGVAEFKPDETATQLIARADNELVGRRL